MSQDKTATATRRTIIVGLTAVLFLPAPAWSQSLCPQGGFHIWVVWGTDKKTGRTIQRCMKCGTFKIG